MITAPEPDPNEVRTTTGGTFKVETHPNGKAEVAGSRKAFTSVGGSQVEPFNMIILREALGAIWVPKSEEDGQKNRIKAVMAALDGFKPTDEIEGMLAAQAVALHFGAMECFRRSMIPEQPGDAASKLRRDGANLARTMTEMLEALDRKRGKRPQVVRVERVVVQDGGQAIVGNVSPTPHAGPAPAALEASHAGPTLDLSPPPLPVRATRGGRGEA